MPFPWVYTYHLLVEKYQKQADRTIFIERIRWGTRVVGVVLLVGYKLPEAVVNSKYMYRLLDKSYYYWT